MRIIGTHIDIVKTQTKVFPFNSELLNIKLENNLVKVTYVDSEQSGTCDVEFRMYYQNEILDFDYHSYKYIGSIEHNSIDYQVFYKIVGQSADLR